MLFICFMPILTWAHAQNPEYDMPGWHWFNDANDVKPESKKAVTQKNKTYTALEQHYRAAFYEALAKAKFHPTEANVRDFLVLVQYLKRQSTRFSQVWAKTLLDYPELDYNIQHPSANNAQRYYYEKITEAENSVMQRMARHYGLIYFYRGREHGDVALASMLSRLTSHYHFAWIAVSVDHLTAPQFSKTVIDQGQAKTLGIRYFPALVLVNPKTRASKVVAYGFITEDDLKRRFLNIATDYKEMF